jgi:very-short-patch-repair endonuclease
VTRGEIAGVTPHGRHATTARHFERDQARDAELVAAGWRVVRLTHRRIHGAPVEVAGMLVRLLGGGGDRGAEG